MTPKKQKSKDKPAAKSGKQRKKKLRPKRKLERAQTLRFFQ